MATEDKFLSAEDVRRLWVMERALPLFVAVVLPVAFIGYCASSEQQAHKRAELRTWLGGPPDTYRIKIDGEPVPNAPAVFDGLKTIREEESHHSSPTEPHLVEIARGKEVRQLCIAQDSERANEYWVSTPNSEGCKAATFGDPYFGMLVTDRPASQLRPARR